MYQSIKENKASSSSKQGQHATAGSGANKAIAEGTAEPEDVMVVEVTWMQPYLAYMINNTLPEDVVEAQRIVRRSKPFCHTTQEIIQEKHNMHLAKVR
jgi:hypothetical protein